MDGHKHYIWIYHISHVSPMAHAFLTFYDITLNHIGRIAHTSKRPTVDTVFFKIFVYIFSNGISQRIARASCQKCDRKSFKSLWKPCRAANGLPTWLKDEAAPTASPHLARVRQTSQAIYVSGISVLARQGCRIHGPGHSWACW